MKTSDYRAQVEAQRVPADRGRIPSVEDTAAAVPQELEILKDAEAPTPRRLQALRNVQSAAFAAGRFAPYRADYLDALRTVAVDKSEDLRTLALEGLAALKDTVGQALLADGLREPEKALVPAANALAFLSLDDHSAVAPLARLVLERDEPLDAKVAALRTLAVDGGAQDLLESLMRDKAQFREVRKMSAISLQKLNGAAFQRIAQEIALDDQDFEDIRATAWNGLAKTPLAERLLSRPSVRASAEALGETLKSGAFKGLLNRLTTSRGT